MVEKSHLPLSLWESLPKTMQIKPTIAVAMSGGTDSSCLAFLLSRWCAECKAKNKDSVDIVGLTVDHDLHESSRNEALAIGDWAKELGFHHHVLKINWGNERVSREDAIRLRPHSSFLGDLAKQQQMHLLHLACLNLGARYLLVGHHEADQCEATWKNLLKSDPKMDNLIGYTFKEDIVSQRLSVHRPFLALSPSRLEATCREHYPQRVWANVAGVSIDKKRIQLALRQNPDLAQPFSELATISSHLQQIYVDKHRDVLALIKSFCVFDKRYMCFLVDLNVFSVVAHTPAYATFSKALSFMLFSSGGRVKKPQKKGLARLTKLMMTHFLRRFDHTFKPNRSFKQSGCIISPTISERLLISRYCLDYDHKFVPLLAPQSSTDVASHPKNKLSSVLWDMRYWVHVRLTTEEVVSDNSSQMYDQIVSMLQDNTTCLDRDRIHDVSLAYTHQSGASEVDKHGALDSGWKTLGNLRVTSLGLRRARKFMQRVGANVNVMRQIEPSGELGKNFMILSNLPVIITTTHAVVCIPHLGYFNQRTLRSIVPQGTNFVVNIVPHSRMPNQTGLGSNPLMYKDTRFGFGVQEELHEDGNI